MNYLLEKTPTTKKLGESLDDTHYGFSRIRYTGNETLAIFFGRVYSLTNQNRSIEISGEANAHEITDKRAFNGKFIHILGSWLLDGDTVAYVGTLNFRNKKYEGLEVITKKENIGEKTENLVQEIAKASITNINDYVIKYSK